ncbi:hypothetical protein TNCV_134041 [Trichonephila clavipes]|nr:hypothetical protein TNCV_134041 [Trichonephila clavipes]
MVREDTGVPDKGASSAWMVADEAVGFTRAFLTMWRSPRRVVCRGRPEPGFHKSIDKSNLQYGEDRDDPRREIPSLTDNAATVKKMEDFILFRVKNNSLNEYERD